MRNIKQKTLPTILATTVTTVLLAGLMATPAMAADTDWNISPNCSVMGAQRLNADDPTEVTTTMWFNNDFTLDEPTEGTWRLDATEPNLTYTFVDENGNEPVSVNTPNVTSEITNMLTDETTPFENDLGAREATYDGQTFMASTGIDYTFHAPVEESLMSFRVGFVNTTGDVVDYAFCLTTIEAYNPGTPTDPQPEPEEPVTPPVVVDPPVVPEPEAPVTPAEPEPVGPKVNSGADYSTNPIMWLPIGLASLVLAGMFPVLAAVRKRETNVAE